MCYVPSMQEIFYVLVGTVRFLLGQAGGAALAGKRKRARRKAKTAVRVLRELADMPQTENAVRDIRKLAWELKGLVREREVTNRALMVLDTRLVRIVDEYS